MDARSFPAGRDGNCFVTMKKAVYSDTIFLLLVVLIAATLAGYMSGFLPYPFGIIVLGLFCVARLLYLHGKS